MAEDLRLWTRRGFLAAGATLVSTVSSVPAFLSSAGRVMAAADERGNGPSRAARDRVLVVIQLSGGNDGLNTVVPYGREDYYRLRPRLAIDRRDALALDDGSGIGLHPRLQRVRELIGEGLGSVIQGVGYPNPNRSHFASMDVWHTGDTDGGRGRGWLGVALDGARTGADGGMTCVSLGNDAPLATYGEQTRAVAVSDPDAFRFAARDLDPALAAAHDRLHEIPPGPDASGPTDFIYRTACDAQVASDRVRRALDREPAEGFPQSQLGRQLERVAAMVAEGLPTRVYYVGMGGFDTHANQPNRHASLLEQFDEAVYAFQRELHATGHAERVTTFAFSEFGRRAAENGSAGTDHGTAGPVFLFGDHVRPGLLGTHPSLENLQNNDLFHTVDFRSIYASLLERWLGLDSRAALGGRFRRAQVLDAGVRG